MAQEIKRIGTNYLRELLYSLSGTEVMKMGLQRVSDGKNSFLLPVWRAGRAVRLGLGRYTYSIEV